MIMEQNAIDIWHHVGRNDAILNNDAIRVLIAGRRSFPADPYSYVLPLPYSPFLVYQVNKVALSLAASSHTTTTYPTISEKPSHPLIGPSPKGRTYTAPLEQHFGGIRTPTPPAIPVVPAPAAAPPPPPSFTTSLPTSSLLAPTNYRHHLYHCHNWRSELMQLAARVCFRNGFCNDTKCMIYCSSEDELRLFRRL